MKNKEDGSRNYDQQTNSVETALSRIKSEFALIPNLPATNMFISAGMVSLSEASKRQRGWESELRYAGMNLVHAKAHSGLLDGAIEFNHGWIIDDSSGLVDFNFAKLALDQYYLGAQHVTSAIPAEIQEMNAEFASDWIKNRFQTDDVDEAMQSLLNPKAIYVPMDHFTHNRQFWGGELFYPPELTVPVFNILKVTAVPLTFFYSDRPENDFKGYVLDMSNRYGIDPEIILFENGSHETAHIISIEPIIHAITNGPSHSWLTEGLVILMSEKAGFRFRLKKDVGHQPSVIEITEGNNVNYGESFLLVTALSYKLGDGNIQEGATILVRKLFEYAKLVKQGTKQKINNFSELLFIIDPELKDQTNMIDLNTMMPNLMKMLLNKELTF